MPTQLRRTLCALLMLTGPMLPAASPAVDLLEVYRLGLASDPEFQSAAAANVAAQEATAQARALLLPDVRANLSVNAREQDIFNAGVFGTSRRGVGITDKDFTLSVTQPLWRQQLGVQLDQAESRVSQADTQYAFARQQLMLRVAERYFGVLRSLDELEFARASKEAIGQQLNQSRQRFEVGLIAITDVEEAKAGFDLAVAAEINAENQLANSREALREVVGEYHERLAQLGGELPLITPEPDDIARWTETALAQNLNLLAARYASETARDEIKRVEAGHLPTIDLVGSHNRSDTTGGLTGGSETATNSIGLQLNVPLYQGGLVVSQTREARALYQQAIEELERARRSAQRQTRDAFLGVKSGISRVMALKQAVVSTQSALDAIEAGFQVGTRTSVDVLNAQRDLFASKRDYAGARYDYILDILSLKQAAGTLSEEDLAEVNAWLVD